MLHYGYIVNANHSCLMARSLASNGMFGIWVAVNKILCGYSRQYKMSATQSEVLVTLNRREIYRACTQGGRNLVSY